MTPSCHVVAPIRRSKEIKAVCVGLHALVERGLIRGFQEGKLRVGRMNIDIDWPDGQASRLRIDIEAATLTFAGLLDASSGSAIHRELKALLRAVQGHSPELHHLHIDPAKAMLRMAEQGGRLSLAIIITSDEYEYCSQRLIELAHEALALLSERKLADSYHPVALSSARGRESTV